MLFRSANGSSTHISNVVVSQAVMKRKHNKTKGTCQRKQHQHHHNTLVPNLLQRCQTAVVGQSIANGRSTLWSNVVVPQAVMKRKHNKPKGKCQHRKQHHHTTTPHSFQTYFSVVRVLLLANPLPMAAAPSGPMLLLNKL